MATHAIEIERPIEDVFAVLTDVTLFKRMMESGEL